MARDACGTFPWQEWNCVSPVSGLSCSTWPNASPGWCRWSSSCCSSPADFERDRPAPAGAGLRARGVGPARERGTPLVHRTSTSLPTLHTQETHHARHVMDHV
jgi:hypothetical protein